MRREPSIVREPLGEPNDRRERKCLTNRKTCGILLDNGILSKGDGYDHMNHARDTFFEAATQHGYVVALMGPRMFKSREHFNIILDPERGRVFRLFKSSSPDVPVFEFVIPDRDTTESTLMWRDKCKKALDKAWKEYEKDRAKAKEARSGEGSSPPSDSAPSKTESSSTDVPPRPEFLNSASVAEEPAISGSDQEPLTRASSPIEPVSSKGSGRPSRKSGSKSRSSSTASTESSG